MKLNATCRKCLLDKYLAGYPESAPPERIAEYRRIVEDAVANDGGRTSPELVEYFTRESERLFGPGKDWTEIKSRYNRLMLTFEKTMESGIRSSRDPLLTAVRYAMIGNYIDFAAVDSVDEGKLGELLEDTERFRVDSDVLSSLKSDLSRAGRLTYVHDNCGEIVADKLLIKTAKTLSPGLEVFSVVRGEQVMNDATEEDAYEVGLDAASTVIGSGNGVGGCVMERLSPEARRAMENADVVISKGQANYETLAGCGLNVYYIFLCKCDRFISEFGVPRFTGMLTREKDFRG